MDTATKLKEMFIEPINHYSGDSGSIYGYRYEDNKKNGVPDDKFIILSDEPKVDLSDIFFNTYWLLNQYCEYDEAKTQKLQELGLQEWELNNGMDKLEAEYTYNMDLCISQDFIFHGYENMFSERFIVIELHNGCDARTGFTDPVVFECNDPEYLFMTTNEDLEMEIPYIEDQYNIEINNDL